MKFYIGQENATLIECDTAEEFIEYLEEMIIAREENGEDLFSITIEN